MPARKWIQRTRMRKFVLKSWGKLICGPKKFARAALAIMPPEISPALSKTNDKKNQCFTSKWNRLCGDCTQPHNRVYQIPKRARILHAVKEIHVSATSRLKSGGNRRIVLAATCRAAQPRETEAVRRQVVPPCSWGGKPARNMLLILILPQASAEGASWCSKVKEP